MENDYGDGPISRLFYGGAIGSVQIEAAKKTRREVERTVGTFADLRKLVGGAPSAATDQQMKRAKTLVTRGLNLQWVQGDASVAEASFFKINSQGTPLDASEELLLRNRRKAPVVAARAIVRAGSGHKYWSKFAEERKLEIEAAAADVFKALFEPEARQPIKTLDLPLAGTNSPVDAMSLLIEFLYLCDWDVVKERAGSKGDSERVKSPDASKGIRYYEDDADGSETVRVLKVALKVARRLTGNTQGSLGLHPAVYFYNERGKHSNALFLGTVLTVASASAGFFHRFSTTRAQIETFLRIYKSTISLVLANVNKTSRVLTVAQLINYLVEEAFAGRSLSIEGALTHLGVHGKMLDLEKTSEVQSFSGGTKSEIYLRQALDSALECFVCGGLLDPNKSVQYDHKSRVREGGTGVSENGQLVHPYCNQGLKQ